MTWEERIANYEKVTGFPKSLFIAADGRVVGTWILGNNYQVKSKYYGGYPNTYLRRVKALFPEHDFALHLFSGRVDTQEFPGETVDINANLHPIYIDDAQTLLKVPLELKMLVLADPPYSQEDCDHYQTSMVKRNTVLRALQRLPEGAYVVWLDQCLPMWKKDFFDLEAIIGVVRSSNHRFRVCCIWRRK